MVAPSDGKIRVVRAHANQVGTTGTTVIDLWRNGNSMYRNPSKRPTLVGTSVGWFSAGAPDEQAFQAGDVLQWRLLSSGGHGQLTVTAALEEP